MLALAVARRQQHPICTARYQQATRVGGAYSNSRIESSVHASASIGAPDQLRQRVAWALAQTYVVSRTGMQKRYVDGHEHFLAYYDIFVRHAFGNLRDVLREVGCGQGLVAPRSHACVASPKPNPNPACTTMYMASVRLVTPLSHAGELLAADGHLPDLSALFVIRARRR